MFRRRDNLENSKQNSNNSALFERRCRAVLSIFHQKNESSRRQNHFRATTRQIEERNDLSILSRPASVAVRVRWPVRLAQLASKRFTVRSNGTSNYSHGRTGMLVARSVSVSTRCRGVENHLDPLQSPQCPFIASLLLVPKFTFGSGHSLGPLRHYLRRVPLIFQTFKRECLISFLFYIFILCYISYLLFI